MLRISMLPAGQGDALLVDWASGGEVHHVLVDGGPASTYPTLYERIVGLGAPPRLDVLVITHIDGDHIEGAVRLLQDRSALGLAVDDVWFNGWPQLAPQSGDRLGADQGEMVGALLQRDKLPWNDAFQGGPVCADVTEPLPSSRLLPGGARAFVIGPGPGQLRALRRDWGKVLRRIGVTPGHPEEALDRLARRRALAGLSDRLGKQAALDNSVANASSIVLFFEFEGRTLLLPGDCHGDLLAAGIRRLITVRGGDRLRVDVFKVPHHGSRANVTPEVLSLVDTRRYLVSTNGARYHHPDVAAIERVLTTPGRDGEVELFFNYRSPTTEAWSDPGRQRRLGYTAHYPDKPGEPLTVTA
jgi:beta-lactamase superfamily II metal-dependent hydrolase